MKFLLCSFLFVCAAATILPEPGVEVSSVPYGPDCSSKEGRFTYPGNESKFIFCYGGKTFVHDCPTGEFWNQEKQDCINPASITTPIPYGPDCSSKDGNFAYPGNESKYIFCYGGKPWVNDCPTGKGFNEDKGICV